MDELSKMDDGGLLLMLNQIVCNFLFLRLICFSIYSFLNGFVDFFVCFFLFTFLFSYDHFYKAYIRTSDLLLFVHTIVVRVKKRKRFSP